MVLRAAAVLADVLRNNDADALPARILELAKQVRASQNVAVERSSKAVLELDNQRISLLVRGKNGHVSEPSSTGSMVGGVVMIVFGQAVSRDWKSRRMAKYAERSRNLGLCGRWAGRKRRRPRF